MLCFFFNFKVFKILSFHHFLFKLLYFNPLSILTLSSICTFVFVPFVFCLFQPLSFYLSVSLFVSLFLNKFLLSTTERNEREREKDLKTVSILFENGALRRGLDIWTARLSGKIPLSLLLVSYCVLFISYSVLTF